MKEHRAISCSESESGQWLSVNLYGANIDVYILLWQFVFLKLDPYYLNLFPQRVEKYIRLLSSPRRFARDPLKRSPVSLSCSLLYFFCPCFSADFCFWKNSGFARKTRIIDERVRFLLSIVKIFRDFAIYLDGFRNDFSFFILTFLLIMLTTIEQ